MKKDEMRNPDAVNPSLEGSRATFTWEGAAAPVLMGDFNNWEIESARPLEPVGKGRWQVSLDFPADTYMEYIFILDGQRVMDPKNPHKVNNGTGSWNNYFYMPEAAPSPFTRRRSRAGELMRFRLEDEIRLLNLRREVVLYQPAAPGPYPLLVVYDGTDYLHRGAITQVVDNLVAAGRIRPVALALVANAGPARFVEYACNDSTVSFITNKVVPLAQEHMPLIDVQTHPGAYGILGASMGGLMALYTGLRNPRMFGSVLCQAGAFCMFEEDFSIFDLIDRPEIPPIRVWMDVGRFDFLYADNLRMWNLLRQKGYAIDYHETHTGHNYTAWRNDMPAGLEYLYPPLNQTLMNTSEEK
ncbi:enterochelin esterase [Longilinea arvoryzae]|uniref:Enterochelin esterase n=1 Tax=Longilinea arvoryzae TaxID=360412 RepID=A0A0S7BDZ3_9CHLR|nr:alpha/beta hydrolase-fold protein [Longilinea arvoryzae]GAP13625.1 enterochelin esterase [Longilinea arvoryzae]